MNTDKWKNTQKKIKTLEKKNIIWDFIIRMIAALFGQGYWGLNNQKAETFILLFYFKVYILEYVNLD